MKTIPLVLTFAAFAAALAAQEPPAKPRITPSQEIAKIVAVEEQERDLAKAETLYREALAGTTLSAEARELATLRLAELLMGLGRREEAKQVMAAIAQGKGKVVALDDVTERPQDLEREKVLREKARALVATVVEDKGQKGNQIGGGGIFGIDQPIAEQLLWIGEPAVPEVIAALETIAKTSGNGYTPAVVRSLAAFLWQTGGAKAEGFLRQALTDTDKAWLAGHYAEAACAATRPDMLAVVEQYLRSPAAGRSVAMLDGYFWGTPLKNRLDPGFLVDVLGRGSVAERQWLLGWALQPGGKTPGLSGEALQKLVPVVRAALASAEPELGAAAQKLLQNVAYLPEHAAGLELLLDQVTSLSPSLHIAVGKWPALDAAQATQLLPKCDAAFRALLPGSLDDPRLNWVHFVAHHVCAPLDARVVPQILAWIDLGASWNLLLACEGKVNAANVAEVVARFERVPRSRLHQVVGVLDKVELTPALFAPLREWAEALASPQGESRAADQPRDQAHLLAMAVARTGHAEAAPWLLAGWRASKARLPWLNALLELGRRNHEEPVRAALRTVLGEVRAEAPLRAQLRLTLLALRDESMLAALAEDPKDAAVVSYGDPGSSPIRPLDYLLHAAPKPPHGFSEDEQLAFVRGMASWKSLPEADHGRHASDRVLMAMVESAGIGLGHAAFRLYAEQGEGPWRRWLDRVIDQPGPARHIVTQLGPADLTRLRPRLEAALNGEDPRFARDVFAAFENSETMQPDFRAHLTNRHEEIRWRCFEMLPSFTDGELLRLLPTMTDDGRVQSIVRRVGDQLVVDAVPQLVALLKSPDSSVRDAAAQALTKIRFYHEQQAHWDRVLKGLDASPASAAEKLLLQGKPGAPKEQRLLAITSLGLLGVPEALPFLIEWTQDADADVAKKAKDAVTQIHLNPRR